MFSPNGSLLRLSLLFNFIYDYSIPGVISWYDYLSCHGSQCHVDPMILKIAITLVICGLERTFQIMIQFHSEPVNLAIPSAFPSYFLNIYL